MANLFEEVSKRVQNSSFAIWLFFMAAVALVIGGVHFVEDTASSYEGIILLEQVFGMRPVIWPVAYLTMSLAPQVGQMVFAYLFLTNHRKNWWAAIVAASWFLIDFAADVQARSGGQLFTTGGSTGDEVVIIITSVMTILYFTVGSELFITAGIGLVLELFAPAIEQFVVLWIRYRQIITDARRKLERLSH